MEGFIVGGILGTWFGWCLCALFTINYLREGGEENG